MTPTLNPFLYGSPVPPDKFVGREIGIQTVFSRINNGEMTAVVGPPRVGKSSVLRYVNDSNTRRNRLACGVSARAWTQFDCHAMPSHYTPKDFWNRILRAVPEQLDDPDLKQRLDQLRVLEYEAYELTDFFRFIESRGFKVVLLIDELETMLSHPNFNRPEFFGAVRSYATTTLGFSVVAASRMRVHEIDRVAKISGSPFFNGATEVVLGHFNDEEVNKLLDRMLSGSGIEFCPQDREYVRRVAGGLPYLVQAAASALFDAITFQRPQEDRYLVASELVNERAEGFFDDLWESLGAEAKVGVAILALSNLEGRLNGRDFDTSDVARLEWYQPELDHLRSLGLVEVEGERKWRADWGSFVIWRGQRWGISADSFAWWVCRNPISKGRHGVSFDEWINNKEFNGWLTGEERRKLGNLAKKVPQTVLTASWGLVESALKSMAAGIGGAV